MGFIAIEKKAKLIDDAMEEFAALGHAENAWIKNNKNRDLISYHDAFTLKAI